MIFPEQSVQISLVKNIDPHICQVGWGIGWFFHKGSDFHVGIHTNNSKAGGFGYWNLDGCHGQFGMVVQVILDHAGIIH